MRLRILHQPHSSAGKINVTPLIDVVMVLIVFYLIVGRLASERLARVELPRTNTGEPASVTGVVIAVTRPTEPGSPVAVVLDGREVSIPALALALQARMPELARNEGQQQRVQLRADRHLLYESIAPVIAACREAGIARLELVSNQEASSP